MPASLDAEGHGSNFSLQVATSMLQNNGNQEREKERQRNHQQLIDVIVTLREEVRKLHAMPLEASQSREQLLLVSLAWLYYVGARNSKHDSRKS